MVSADLITMTGTVEFANWLLSVTTAFFVFLNFCLRHVTPMKKVCIKNKLEIYI